MSLKTSLKKIKSCLMGRDVTAIDSLLGEILDKTNLDDDASALRTMLWQHMVAVDAKRRRIVAHERNQTQQSKDIRYVQSSIPPWRSVELPDCTIPGMITDEERQYYVWLGSQYSGSGEVVELGPWLGRSTYHIVHGLKDNVKFAGRQLYVYEDFVWRSSWMDGYFKDSDRPADKEDFLPLFRKYTEAFSSYITAERRRLSVGSREEAFGKLANPYSKMKDIPHLEWSHGPVEFLFVDVGRTIDVNEAWYDVFAPRLIPNKSLVIMQDWRTCMESPEQWYNQTRLFTDGKHQTMSLIHELQHGGVATFLWKGLP